MTSTVRTGTVMIGTVMTGFLSTSAGIRINEKRKI